MAVGGTNMDTSRLELTRRLLHSPWITLDMYYGVVAHVTRPTAEKNRIVFVRYLVAFFMTSCISTTSMWALEPGFYGIEKKEQISPILANADRQVVVSRDGYELPGLS